MDYPNPNHEFYLLFEIETYVEKEFEKLKWNIHKLVKNQKKFTNGVPFCCSLSEVMRVVSK